MKGKLIYCAIFLMTGFLLGSVVMWSYTASEEEQTLKIREIKSGDSQELLDIRIVADERPFSIPLEEGHPKILVSVKNISNEILAMPQHFILGHPSAVWSVFDADGNELSVFPYKEKKKPSIIIHPWKTVDFELGSWPNCSKIRVGDTEFTPGVYTMNLSRLKSNDIRFEVDTNGVIKIKYGVSNCLLSKD